MSDEHAVEYEYLIAEFAPGISRIFLNRPEKRNAMNRAAQAELWDALGRAAAVDSKVTVLSAQGPAFCSGVDKKEIPSGLDRLSQPITRSGGNSWSTINAMLFEHPSVTIASVGGVALGGGVTLVNSCDLAVASERAEFGMPEVTFGLWPAYAGPSTIFNIHPKTAAWMVLTGQRACARDAKAWGLVNEVVLEDRLEAETNALAERIASFDRDALSACKSGLRALRSGPGTYTQWLDAGATQAQELAALRIRRVAK